MKTFSNKRQQTKFYSTAVLKNLTIPAISEQKPIVVVDSSHPSEIVSNTSRLIASKKLDMKNQKIVNVATPTDGGDAVTLLYLHTQLEKLNKVRHKNVDIPKEPLDAVNKTYVDSAIAQQYKTDFTFKSPQKFSIFAQGISTNDSQFQNFFEPGILLNKCTINSLQWISSPGHESKMYIISKPLVNGAGAEKREIGRKTKMSEMHEFLLNITIENPTIICFQAETSNISSVFLHYTNTA